MVSLSVTTTISPVSSLKKLLTSQPIRELTLTAPTPKAPIERLPTHVILEIGRQSSLRDVLYLGLCSRRLRKLLATILYSTVELKTNKHCKTTLIALSKHPEITQHIRRLIIRPNSLEWTNPGDEMNEDQVATLIASMAGQLRNLEAFEWDGMDMPHNELWAALRTPCRYLKRISTSIGEDTLDPSSSLWDFNDLRQISLTVKCRSLDWLAEGLPKTEKLPRKFWAMLLERCPRLEELTIGGSAPSPRIFDIRLVTAGRWPRLHSITLGDMVLISPSKGDEQARKDRAAFMAFLAAHPTLRSIHLQHAGGSATFPSKFILPSNALPNVTSFGGPLKLIKTLPNPQRLQHLTLTCLHHTASSFPPTFAVLHELKALTSLNLWIDLSFGSGGSFAFSGRTSGENLRGHQKFDDAQVLRSLFASRPSLKHLEVSCFTRPTFSIREFSRVLQTAPNLESFELTKVHKSNEEEMTRSAARIVNENPNIKKFTVRTTQDSWFSPAKGRVKQLGVYEVLGYTSHIPFFDGALPTSIPVTSAAPALLACEWGQKNITGKEYSRYFVHFLVPKEKENTSFGRHPHSLSLSRIYSHTSPSELQNEPNLIQSWHPSRSSSNASSFLKRSRRASCSVVGSITNAVVTMASPRSSMSSASGSHRSVTWADQGLGRSGSGSTTGSGRRALSPETQSTIEEDYVLV
ncbi:hypothetical protein BDZ97DRAFT_1911460 [Flammula alnicola]|nr:hypothetical protein BDZ97DRAFT_1911460 [Flammula alnicola]